MASATAAAVLCGGVRISAPGWQRATASTSCPAPASPGPATMTDLPVPLGRPPPARRPQRGRRRSGHRTGVQGRPRQAVRVPGGHDDQGPVPVEAQGVEQEPAQPRERVAGVAQRRVDRRGRAGTGETAQGELQAVGLEAHRRPCAQPHEATSPVEHHREHLVAVTNERDQCLVTEQSGHVRRPHGRAGCLPGALAVPGRPPDPVLQRGLPGDQRRRPRRRRGPGRRRSPRARWRKPGALQLDDVGGRGRRRSGTPPARVRSAQSSTRDGEPVRNRHPRPSMPSSMP